MLSPIHVPVITTKLSRMTDLLEMVCAGIADLCEIRSVRLRVDPRHWHRVMIRVAFPYM